MQWGRFYRSIYEMLPGDKPEDRIIDDDAELDRWYDSYVRDIAIRNAEMKRNEPRRAAPQPTAIFGG
jgi:hypothetical protein